MSISGANGLSASSDSHSNAFDSDNELQSSDAVGEIGFGLSSDSPTTGELLAQQQTDFDNLTGIPGVFEQLTGSPSIGIQPEFLDNPIVLAQSNGLIPDIVMQDLQRQLQPLHDGLEGVLGEPAQPDLPGQPALDLIAQHRDTILAAAEQYDVDPMQIASIIFQEKFHGNWADAKNTFGAWPQIILGANDASIGLAEMDINTAARLMGVDSATMTSQQRNNIIESLSSDTSAIGLIAANVASFEARLGRDVTLKEATYGHNAGVDALVRDLPIERGSTISRRSWDYQESIAAALGLR